MPKARRPFRPRYHPRAGVRRARAEQRALADEERRAEERAEQRQRWQEDHKRIEMMARLEPERYLRQVAAGLLWPSPTLMTEAQERIERKR